MHITVIVACDCGVHFSTTIGSGCVMIRQTLLFLLALSAVWTLGLQEKMSNDSAATECC